MLSFFVVMSSSGNYILQDSSLFEGLKNKIGLIHLIKWFHYGYKLSDFHVFFWTFWFITQQFYGECCYLNVLRRNMM